MTGNESSSTKSHSLSESGTMLKISAKKGTYRIKKCRPKDTAHASSRYGFLQGGICTRELSCNAACWMTESKNRVVQVPSQHADGVSQHSTVLQHSMQMG